MTKWTKRLTNAKRRGFFNEEDIDLAGNFASCAVSELGERAHRIDGRLYDLAIQFAGDVGASSSDIVKARKTYRAIHARGKDLELL